MLQLYSQILKARASVRQATRKLAHEHELSALDRSTAVFALKTAQCQLARAEVRVRERVLGFVHRRLAGCGLPTEHKQELGQEICFRILKTGTLEGFRGSSEGEAIKWTATVVQNFINSECRRDKRAREKREGFEQSVATGTWTQTWKAPPPGEGTSFEQIWTCAVEGVHRFLDERVPDWLLAEWRRVQAPLKRETFDAYLEVWKLQHLDGLSNRGAAEAPGLTPSAARKATSRASLALRLGAAKALLSRCCDLATRTALEAWVVGLGLGPETGEAT